MILIASVHDFNFLSGQASEEGKGEIQWGRSDDARNFSNKNCATKWSA